MKHLNYFSDPGHSWLAVKLDMLHILGIVDKISAFSYVKGRTAYLEEDVDAPVFIKAYEKRFGKIMFNEKYSDKSPIRSYRSYSVDGVTDILKRNGVL